MSKKKDKKGKKKLKDYMTKLNKGWFIDKLKSIKLSQRKLAEKMNIDPAAVSYMFSGKRDMSMDEAKSIASIFGMPVTEIMRQAGIDVLDDIRRIPVTGYISNDHAVTLLPKGTYDMVDAPPDMPNKSFALQYRDSTGPVDGWLVYISGEQKEAAELLDEAAMCTLSDGRIVNGIIRRGYKKGLFNILLARCHNETSENQSIADAHKILWVRPT